MKKEIKTSGAPSAPNMSQATELGGLVITSGQIHLTKDGKLIEGTMEVKAKQVLDNLETVLTSAGLSFKDVLKVTVYVTDMSEYSNFNEIYATYFTAPYPAREVVCVKELPLGASVEVSMIAKR